MTGTAGHEQSTSAVDLFGERLRELGVGLSVAGSEAEALELVARLTGTRSWTAWRDPLLDRIELSGTKVSAELAEVSLIRADVAVAETGTIGFAHLAGRSRGAALLPAAQVALLDSRDLVRTVAEALERLFADGDPAQAPSNVVFVTGPSRTADIELHPIIGVHSPKKLDVVLAL